MCGDSINGRGERLQAVSLSAAAGQQSMAEGSESALFRLAEIAADFAAQRISADLRSLAERVSEGRFYVAAVGQFKRGKSTLLNALVGQPVLPAAVVPVTSIPTILRYGDSLSARVRFQDAAWVEIPVPSVAEYVSEENNPENARGVAGIEIFVPSKLLGTGMCLADTPGLGSVFAGSTAATRAFIPHIDAAFIVMGVDPPLSGEELQLVDRVAQDVRELIFVLNKADRANEQERAEAVEFSRRVLEARLGREVATVYEVSALERLEQRGPLRDWNRLLEALESLQQHSGRPLVREAANRGLRRAAHELLRVIREERGELLRPVEESQRRIEQLRKTLAEAELTLNDLCVLLSAEQQRLSQVFSERRGAYYKNSLPVASREFGVRAHSVCNRRNGPAYRREVMRLVQEIAREQLTPWLRAEEAFAEDAFRQAAERFVQHGNDFLRRLAATGLPGVEQLPEELDPPQGLRSPARFHFHMIERVAAPASPFVLVKDFLLGGLALHKGILRDAQDFLQQLLEVNSSRVESDVAERLHESRKELEGQIRGLRWEASAVAERALAHAHAEQAAGAPAVDAALARLDRAEREVLGLLPRPEGDPRSAFECNLQ